MDPIRVMTFNIRFDSEEGGVPRWQDRRAEVLTTIRANDPDLISLQEPDASQWADICEQLTGYSPFGAFDGESDNVEPHGGLVRTNRFDRREEGVFWLSDTPSVPHSVSWENDWEPRVVGWARLRDRATDRELVFAGTHFDTNARAWLPSARVLHREVDAISRGTPSIVAGDFNCAAGSEAHGYLLDQAGFRDTWYDAGHSDADILTFHGFTGRRHLPVDPVIRDRWFHTITGEIDTTVRDASQELVRPNYRIDWILVRGELRCLEARIEYGVQGAPTASDHYPVIALLDWVS